MNNFIEDNNTYILARDKQKHNVTNFQIHDIVFKIILEIDRICRKRNIPYALAFGSALGLYNYGDFIPWDDDADIIIDYFPMIRAIPGSGSPFCIVQIAPSAFRWSERNRTMESFSNCFVRRKI